MELEEEIKIVKEIITHKEDFDYAYGTKIERPYTIDFKQIQAIETVLQALENSISKKKIEDKKKQIDYRTANGEERYYQKAILQELLEDK